MENRKHYLAGILAFVIWGFFSIALRALQSYAAGEILFYRILFSAIVLVVVIAFFKRQAVKSNWQFFKSLTPRQRNLVIALTLTGGALLTLNWLTFIYTVNSINIKTASFSYLICPVITAVLGYVLLKEKMTTLQWTAVGLCALSCVLIGMHSALELGYSMLTAVSYALYLVSQRRNQGFDRLLMLGIQMIFALFILLLLVNLLVGAPPEAGRFYFVISIIAVVFTVLPLFLNLYALNRVNSATIGILMYLNPLLNFVIAFTIFKESVEVTQLIGYVVVLGALVLFNYPLLRKVQQMAR